MKKLALVLALVLCLTACTVAFAEVTVKFFHRWPNEPKLSYLNGLIAEFEAANPDIKIVTDQVLNDSYKEKIASSSPPTTSRTSSCPGPAASRSTS